MNQGSSGGYRVIIIYSQGQHIFFVHGFLKANEDNITVSEQEDFKSLANVLLLLNNDELAQLLRIKQLMELDCNERN